jgi:hypothetical protein
MIKVLSNLGNGHYGYIPLQDSLIKYNKTANIEDPQLARASSSCPQTKARKNR